MNVQDVVGLVLAFGIGLYLLIALVRAEEF